MGDFKKCFWRKTWLVSMGMAMSVQAGQAAEPDPAAPKLIVQIVNLANVPDNVLDKAKDHTQHIYDRAEVRIVWLDRGRSSEAAAGGDGLRLTIFLIDEPMVEKLGPFEDPVTGLAVRSARRAWAFIDRARTQAALFNVGREIEAAKAEGVVLGTVIAHEIGHIVLPSDTHAAAGIMRPSINSQGFSEAMRGALLFSSREASLIRETLREQASPIQAESLQARDWFASN